MKDKIYLIFISSILLFILPGMIGSPGGNVGNSSESPEVSYLTYENKTGINEQPVENETVESSEHYLGVDTFYDDTYGQAPDDWSYNGNGQCWIDTNQAEAGGHDKIVRMNKRTTNPQITKSFSSRSTGDIEYWWRRGEGTLLILNPIDYCEVGNQTNDIMIKVGHQNGKFGWYSSLSTFSPDNRTNVANKRWYHIRIQFRCESAPEFGRLKENSYHLYIDQDLKASNVSFIENSTTLYGIRYTVTTGVIRLDAISWTWGTEEISGESYNRGDNFNTHDYIIKNYYLQTRFDYEYLRVVKLWVDMNITLNITLDNHDTYDNVTVYNYEDDTFDVLLDNIDGNSTIDGVEVYPSFDYLNRSCDDHTNTLIVVSLSNFYSDFNYTVNTIITGMVSVYVDPGDDDDDDDDENSGNDDDDDDDDDESQGGIPLFGVAGGVLENNNQLVFMGITAGVFLIYIFKDNYIKSKER